MLRPPRPSSGDGPSRRGRRVGRP